MVSEALCERQQLLELTGRERGLNDGRCLKRFECQGAPVALEDDVPALLVARRDHREQLRWVETVRDDVLGELDQASALLAGEGVNGGLLPRLLVSKARVPWIE
ncbi:hypothetical protein Q7F20_03515 [Curtobacterium sp. A7_M15]|uniref:hypothetical protein n=1 Tax=Curtobacterium sp. A7_M15 TaxID=3065241 RepID=UPI002737F045|nr:hypothetical protein [Curtobacterium sp. A7_M15]MDP4332426.1 hypothetical protein [Curtobacterium sp. A7_M15]